MSGRAQFLEAPISHLVACWLIMTSAALAACTPKNEMTCAQDGPSGASLGPPWTALGVGEGEVCVSSPERLEFIVKNKKDVASYARAISSKAMAGSRAKTHPKQWSLARARMPTR